MKRLIIIAALAASAAHAENWTIDQKLRDECAKEGGCVLTIPDGHLIKLKEINQAIDQLARQAFEAGAMQGLAAGKQTCGRKDI